MQGRAKLRGEVYVYLPAPPPDALSSPTNLTRNKLAPLDLTTRFLTSGAWLMMEAEEKGSGK